MSKKYLVVYSSLTGNTKKVGEAIADELGMHTDIFPVEDNPDYSAYDVVVVGYWVDKGTADAKARKYLTAIKNSTVAVFATLGAPADSEHAKESLTNGIKLLDESNTVVGSFICQGKIDPKVIEMMMKHFGTKGGFHAVDESRRERHRQASTHPDEQDLANARAYFKALKNKLEG